MREKDGGRWAVKTGFLRWQFLPDLYMGPIGDKGRLRGIARHPIRII